MWWCTPVIISASRRPRLLILKCCLEQSVPVWEGGNTVAIQYTGVSFSVLWPVPVTQQFRWEKLWYSCLLAYSLWRCSLPWQEVLGSRNMSNQIASAVIRKQRVRPVEPGCDFKAYPGADFPLWGSISFKFHSLPKQPSPGDTRAHGDISCSTTEQLLPLSVHSSFSSETQVILWSHRHGVFPGFLQCCSFGFLNRNGTELTAAGLLLLVGVRFSLC